jgi:hypothetical protein
MKLKALIRRLPAAGTALGVAGFLLFSTALPAQALAHGHPVHSQHPGKGHYKKAKKFKHHNHHRHQIRGGRVYVSGARFVAPPRIVVAADVRAFGPYYQGRIYYGPHRHHHAAYLFPVATPYGVAYQPHYYCGGDLHTRARVSFSSPSFSVSVGF